MANHCTRNTLAQVAVRAHESIVKSSLFSSNRLFQLHRISVNTAWDRSLIRMWCGASVIFSLQGSEKDL